MRKPWAMEKPVRSGTGRALCGASDERSSNSLRSFTTW